LYVAKEQLQGWKREEKKLSIEPLKQHTGWVSEGVKE